jgi:hypothetical protein
MLHAFVESPVLTTPIRDMALTITGTVLEPVIQEFLQELEKKGLTRFQPHFYLSSEWGVPFNTISIAIPFYLARPDLIDVHAKRIGHLEGVGRADLLRYLRHEMGHVVCYAYKLYDDEEWIKTFGSITQPYVEEYRPVPFSQSHVMHLPGWYAQKHPEEDWAETFAVWMTPRYNWRKRYAEWPGALAKLEYCDRLMAKLMLLDPLVKTVDADEDVSTITTSVDEFYRQSDGQQSELPPGMDGALLAIFDDYDATASNNEVTLPASDLILKLERELIANVYRWTGHFPESTRQLVHMLAQRAQQLQQVYPQEKEVELTVAITTMVTSLAMNHVVKGSYQ